MCLTAPTFQIAPVGPYKSLRNTSQLDCVCVNEHEEGRRPRWPLRSTRSRTQSPRAREHALGAGHDRGTSHQ